MKPKFVLKTDEETSESALVVNDDVSVPKQAVPLTRFLVGTYNKDGMWYLTTAKFDPATGSIGKFTETKVGKEWALIREAMDLAIARLHIYEIDNFEGEA